MSEMGFQPQQVLDGSHCLQVIPHLHNYFRGYIYVPTYMYMYMYMYMYITVARLYTTL